MACRSPFSEERLLAASRAFSREDALAFLGVRMPAEYASLCRVFRELKIRGPAIAPSKTLVFGAGPGTAVWALLEVRSTVPIVAAIASAAHCHFRCRTVIAIVRFKGLKGPVEGAPVQQH